MWRAIVILKFTICLRYNVNMINKKLICTFFFKDIWTSWFAEYMYVFLLLVPWHEKACKNTKIKINWEQNRIHSLSALDYISYLHVWIYPILEGIQIYILVIKWTWYQLQLKFSSIFQDGKQHQSSCVFTYNGILN